MSTSMLCCVGVHLPSYDGVLRYLQTLVMLLCSECSVKEHTQILGIKMLLHQCMVVWR